MLKSLSSEVSSSSYEYRSSSPLVVKATSHQFVFDLEVLGLAFWFSRWDMLYNNKSWWKSSSTTSRRVGVVVCVLFMSPWTKVNLWAAFILGENHDGVFDTTFFQRPLYKLHTKNRWVDEIMRNEDNTDRWYESWKFLLPTSHHHCALLVDQ